MDHTRKERNTISPWAHSIQETYELFASSVDGITDAEAATRLKNTGPNRIAKSSKDGVLRIFASQFSSPLIFMLIGAAVITIILGEVIDTVVILLAIVINTALGFFQEYRAEETLQKLIAYIKDRTRVVRGGKEKEIDSADLVYGDCIRLSIGMRIPADARVISVNNFSVDEAILTGESLPVTKNVEPEPEGAIIAERSNMVFGGTLVVEGYATAIITATGGETEIGKIAGLVADAESEPTPLQRSIKGVSWIIFAGVVVIVTALFFLGISKGEPVLQMLLLSVAVAVGAIPEALPIALTIILTAGISRIAKHKGIVRKLSAAETLGSTTLVMTDKTGTLTQAKMQLTAVLTAEELASERSPGVQEHFSVDQKSILSKALRCVDVVIENPEEDVSLWRVVGRPLETNIALAARKAGIDVVGLLKDRMPVLPFNSTNKFSVTYSISEKIHIVMGAPDILLARSKMDKDTFVKIEERIHAVASEGKRLIGLARLPEHGHVKDGVVDPAKVTDLEFLGALVLYDPIRPEAMHAIGRIEAHGARVVMVTGDLKGTAIAIAHELGWIVHEGQVMTGAELREFGDGELRQKIADIKIFSRVTPEDKLRIGKLYQSRGEIVAMTGDGVNDAPSLKAADIGVALGSGSDVAKSAADLVVLDDNFETIVLAIEEGRRIVSNIRKAFAYLMSNCLDEVMLVGGALIAGLAMPLTALQIIWVNFFTGSLTALSYAFEENRDVGYGKAGAQRQIFNTEVRVLTIGIGLLTSFLLFVLYWALLSYGFSVDTARTILFACFSSYILVIAFSFKSLHRPLFSYPLFDNRALNFSLIFAAVLVVLSFTLPFLRNMLSIEALPVVYLPLVVFWFIFNVAVVEGAKWLVRIGMRMHRS